MASGKVTTAQKTMREEGYCQGSLRKTIRVRYWMIPQGPASSPVTTNQASDSRDIKAQKTARLLAPAIGLATLFPSPRLLEPLSYSSFPNMLSFPQGWAVSGSWKRKSQKPLHQRGLSGSPCAGESDDYRLLMNGQAEPGSHFPKPLGWVLPLYHPASQNGAVRKPWET
jgi:hypothetical protein